MSVDLKTFRRRVMAMLKNVEVEVMEATRLPEDFKRLPSIATGQMILQSQAMRNSIYDDMIAATLASEQRVFDPHPWLLNAREHVRMLRGEIRITHAKASDRITCQVCNQAVLQKAEYILSFDIEHDSRYS